MINNIISIIVTNGFILIIPGLNFALISRIAVVSGIRDALMCAVGITLAILIHSTSAILGIHHLLEKNKMLFDTVKILGGMFVLYIAIRILGNAAKKIDTTKEAPTFLFGSPFKQGFLVDILNPFVMFFYVGLFSQVITTQTTLLEISVYLGCVVLLTISWFSLVAVVFSRPNLQNFAINHRRTVELISGIALSYFGFRMIIN